MNNALTKTVFGNKLKQQMTLEEAISFLTIKGLLNEGELAEKAISKKSGIAQCTPGTPAIDLINGIQIKHARSHFLKNNSRLQKAYISIKGTKAPICAVVTESVTNQQYFLYIPYKDRKHLTGNTISICFDEYGCRGSSQWWLNDVGSFENLCKLAKNA